MSSPSTPADLSRAESIREAREELGRFADLIGMPVVRADDPKTIVTEACNNVVLHAYPDGVGIVEAKVGKSTAQELEVVVRDFGGGIYSQSDSKVPSLRTGLPIIGAFSTGCALESRHGKGTVLRTTLPLQ